MIQEKNKAAFITFYSFKGGVGRSLALLNTAGILAGRGFQVLVIDLDLDTPGLSFLKTGEPGATSPQAQAAGKPDLTPGFVDLLGDAKTRGREGDLFVRPVGDLVKTHARPCPVPAALGEFTDGSLHIMPGGRFDRAGTGRLEALNLRALFEHGLGEPLIQAFKKKFAEAGVFDYILVDSHPGLSAEAEICTRDLADHLVILSGLNRQSVAGTCEFLKALRGPSRGEAPRFDLIVSPVPASGGDLQMEEREQEASAAFAEAWGAPVDLELQIPYHLQLALTEELQLFRRPQGGLIEAYRQIERRLLVSLGHDAGSLLERVQTLLNHGDFVAALPELRRLVRLDGGKASLSGLACALAFRDREPPGEAAEAEIAPAQVTLDQLLNDEYGRRVLEFIIDSLPLGKTDWGADLLLERLQGKMAEMADRLFQRKIKAAPSDPRLLCAYAVFLEKRRKDLVRAGEFFKRAAETDPPVAGILGRCAVFLDGRGDTAGAEACFQRALAKDPEHAGNLERYTQFLSRHEDRIRAEAFRQRAQAAGPQIVDDPEKYAVLLDRRRDMAGAEVYFKRALEADPNSAYTLCNYGQFLAGLNRLAEGRDALLLALNFIDRTDLGDMAEVCFSLWLVSRMMGLNALSWERVLKYAIKHGFKRSPWSFDHMLEQAGMTLQPEELEYAEALVAAFLDATKVADLKQLERWRALEPLNPLDLPKAVPV